MSIASHIRFMIVKFIIAISKNPESPSKDWPSLSCQALLQEDKILSWKESFSIKQDKPCLKSINCAQLYFSDSVKFPNLCDF